MCVELFFHISNAFAKFQLKSWQLWATIGFGEVNQEFFLNDLEKLFLKQAYLITTSSILDLKILVDVLMLSTNQSFTLEALHRPVHLFNDIHALNGEADLFLFDRR